eukprot:TRINITY_DN2117_c7_g1_i1.p1 TRINITY_DN2117_c7_g1~~TRINITY_DN2117_c7_g1_i1.p1  ORF type:complete len:514 (+),score=94.17 TRINITY_DN2117_c7_g1_i1:34-1575(+)
MTYWVTLLLLLAAAVPAGGKPVKGSWGNVLGTEEHVEVPESVKEFVMESINEHWARDRRVSHISQMELKEIISSTRQVMTFSKDGKKPLKLKMRSWDGETSTDPLLLGVRYDLNIIIEQLAEPPATTDIEKEASKAFKKTKHHITIQGDREGLFSMVLHTWQPVGSSTWETPTYSQWSPLLSLWFGIAEPPVHNKSNAINNLLPLRIVCYNIWNFNNPWSRRLELLTRKIKEGPPPDIIAFQEVRYDNAGDQLGPEHTRHQVDHLLWRMESVGLYQVIWIPAMSYIQDDRALAFQTEGPAIFTRLPVTRVEALQLTRFWPEDSGDEHQRLCLSATVETEQLGKVNVLTSHLTLSDDARLNNAYEICQFAREMENKEGGGKVTVFMGDLNMIPSDNAMKYLLGEYEYKGDRCDFKDVWLLPGKRTHELDGEAGEEGLTFNNLNAKLEKRIDFVLVRGAVDMNSFELMEVIGAKSKSPDELPPSDHMGLSVLVNHKDFKHETSTATDDSNTKDEL